MQLVLDSNGLTVKKRNDRFWIIHKDGRRMISPHRISSIAVTRDCLFSSSAIRLAIQHQIPIYFFNNAGKVEGQLWSPNFGSISTIRRQQVLLADRPEATQWIIRLFQLKGDHQAANLKWLSGRRTAMKEKIEKAILQMEVYMAALEENKEKTIPDCRNTLMGIEGNIARRYWELVSDALPPEFQFGTRSRRPALNFFNAAVNYYYGMLYGVVGAAAMAAGLDPHLGYLHADEYRKPTFVFDLIEPFRPWVDRLLIDSFLTRKVAEKYFTEKSGGYYLNKEGKQYFIPRFNDFMEERRIFNGRRLSNRNHIYRFAGEFAEYLKSRADVLPDLL